MRADEAILGKNWYLSLQDASREDDLVNRLMRQSQMERRIAVQLMHTRHEKEAIKRNRMELEKQFTERRLQDFQQALDREAVSFCLCVCVCFLYHVFTIS